MEQEIWKDIKGFEGEYQVSNQGRVRSIKNTSVLILKPDMNKGYLRVRLSKHSKYTRIFIHRLVAMAFIPNPDNLPQINHKNEVKTDNRVENLEWCTREYNYFYGTAQQRRTKSKGRKVAQYTLQGNLIRTFDSIKEAIETTGIRNIKPVLYGYKWHKTAGGFLWKKI